MDNVIVKCGLCGHENTVPWKPEPQTESQRKQVYFHCKGCKRINRRDGSVVGQSQEVKNSGNGPETVPAKPKEEGGFLELILGILGMMAVILWGKNADPKNNNPQPNHPKSPRTTIPNPWDPIR